MKTTETLKYRVVRAASWAMGGHVFSQLLRLVSNLIMTRILVPEMFGIMAIANVIMMGLSMMSDVGIRQHIIQSLRSDSAKFLNTAWTVQIIRGCLLWSFALLISWGFFALADYNLWVPESAYANPMLPYIITTLSFTAVINGLESTNLAIANRNLVMNIVVKIELISQLIGVLCMIGWAYFDQTIWALVVGSIISSIVKAVSSHVFLPGNKNSLCLERESLYELLHFGKWIFLTSILGFLVVNGDRLILGGLIDAKLLGVYIIALFIVNAIHQILGSLIGSTVLPALSEVVRNRPNDLKETYYKFRLPVDIVTFLLAGILFMTGDMIIDALYDDRYSAAGHMLEILSFTLIMERYSLTNQCYMAMGKPRLLIPVISLRMVFLYLALPISFFFNGIDAAVWAIAGASYAALPVIIYYKLKNNLLDFYKEIMSAPFFLIGMLIGFGLETVYKTIVSP